MTNLLLATLLCLLVKTSFTLPTPTAEDTLPSSDIRQAVKHHTEIFVSKSDKMITDILNSLPNTIPYEKSRQTLEAFLSRSQKLITKLENCDWNIVDFGHNIQLMLNYFQISTATPEARNVLALLKEKGFMDLKEEVRVTFWKFLEGGLGSPGDINEDHC